MITIDFRNIRSLDGSQHQGFEKLCAQLARAEIPRDAKFYRVAPPDAGVECYAILPNGDEWGWQAKYFDQLTATQWRQIDKSVKRALEKYPKLVRYYICTPLDRTHVQTQKWKKYVEQWQQIASEKGMSVEFIWWGKHELFDRLNRPQHAGLVRFFFDTERFDLEWFEARLEEAIKSAGPRYTPEVHIDLPITRKFEAFGWTEQFFDELKDSARKVREKARYLSYPLSSIPEEAEDIRTSIHEITERVKQLVQAVGEIEPDPAKLPPLDSIAEKAGQIADDAEKIAERINEHEKKFNAQKARSGESEKRIILQDNPFRTLRIHLRELEGELIWFQEFLKDVYSLASGQVLLITGEAGTGKTHLLCDIAKNRIQEGKPTILLMGQRFTSTEEPWVQALQHLDLRDLSVDEFIGALEAAARVANCRALIMIDALNEGCGREIWTNHLAAFLERLKRSDWIGVVLTVRSSYKNVIIPEEIQQEAIQVTHHGFAGHEYEAVKNFFNYYGLELPSSPLLLPEFSNPLFLKMLCQGLKKTGHQRLPRGFHGITAVFELFLRSINEELTKKHKLDYDPKENLVQKALNRFAEELVRRGERWLRRDEAKRVIDSFLPGRDFSRSLFYGLVTEGILLESITEVDGQREDVVQIAYDRFADYLIAKHLIERCLNSKRLEEAFGQDGPLGFLWNPDQYVPEGLLEALCIQIPEQTGKELLKLIPALEERWEFKHAFFKNLVFRDPKTISKTTCKIFKKLIKDEQDLYEALEVLLTLAVVPEHPLNARFLDRILRKYTMPDRDAWWSIYLHYAYSGDQSGAVNRLIDWASSITPDQQLEDEVVDLCSTSLAWMLTTSNRFLRDRATKALVSLLTGRIDATIRLVERFADVNDPYVAERVYAVAYGVAMRSHNPEAVGALAETVYKLVFANNKPPPHILLRDYARGVIERALYLGAKIDIDPEKIRPPYKSNWPHIPTEDEIKPYLPNWSRGSYDKADLEWACNRIVSSVLEDDFARYIIGTNSGYTHWLSLRFDEPKWQSLEERLSALVAEFSEEEKKAWQAFEAVDTELRYAVWQLTFKESLRDTEATDTNNPANLPVKEDTKRIQELELQRENAFKKLKETLTESHFQRLEEILSAKEKRETPPLFDLRLIQRYVLKRVFDLGWTTERFGHFDRFAIGYHGREARKAERIGKKYQWIAYHEIMAYISDHFQYYKDENEKSYEGPWQEHLRDIDPSCTLQSIPGGTSWVGHSQAWWCPVVYDKWETPENYQEWVKRKDDLPQITDLLVVTDPKDGSQWVNLQGYVHWYSRPPVHLKADEVEKRELWFLFHSYLIRKKYIQAFMEWAKKKNFWGRWMPEPPEFYEIFLGEYGWAPAYRYFQRPYYGATEWIHPAENCPVQVKVASAKYTAEVGGYDCSIDESFTFYLPAVDILKCLKLRWTGIGADFVNKEGELIAFDPTVHEKGPNALLIRLDELNLFLEREQFALCWVVIGEKLVLGPGFLPDYSSLLQISGAYRLSPEGPKGFPKFGLERRGNLE